MVAAETIEATLVRLEEKGFVDDAKAARDFVDGRSRR
jgi:SOS response regulatory protein OraA/RecX